MKSTFVLYSGSPLTTFVVTIVPEGVLVRDDHVQAGFDRALHDAEAAEHRG